MAQFHGFCNWTEVRRGRKSQYVWGRGGYTLLEPFLYTIFIVNLETHSFYKHKTSMKRGIPGIHKAGTFYNYLAD